MARKKKPAPKPATKPATTNKQCDNGGAHPPHRWGPSSNYYCAGWQSSPK